MCEFDPSNGGRHIDPCMVGLVRYLRAQGLETVACCCGHGVHPMTVVVRGARGPYELCSNIPIPRARRFYQRDADGVYYIPEVSG